MSVPYLIIFIFFIFLGNFNAQAAVRLNASGDLVLYDTSAPSGDFTVMGWVYITTDRNDWTAFFWIGDDTESNAASSIFIGANTTGTQIEVNVVENTVTDITGSNLSTGTWYHIAVVGNTGPAEGLALYLNGASDGTGTSGNGAFSAERVQVGNNSVSEYLDGRVCAFKLYNAQLTQAEVQQEMRHIRPVRTANLWQWAPLWGSGDVADYSGNGRNFTAANLSTEDNPPVGW